MQGVAARGLPLSTVPASPFHTLIAEPPLSSTHRHHHHLVLFPCSSSTLSTFPRTSAFSLSQSLSLSLNLSVPLFSTPLSRWAIKGPNPRVGLCTHNGRTHHPKGFFSIAHLSLSNFETQPAAPRSFLFFSFFRQRKGIFPSNKIIQRASFSPSRPSQSLIQQSAFHAL